MCLYVIFDAKVLNKSWRIFFKEYTAKTFYPSSVCGLHLYKRCVKINISKCCN